MKKKGQDAEFSPLRGFRMRRVIYESTNPTNKYLYTDEDLFDAFRMGIAAAEELLDEDFEIDEDVVVKMYRKWLIQVRHGG